MGIWIWIHGYVGGCSRGLLAEYILRGGRSGPVRVVYMESSAGERIGS